MPVDSDIKDAGILAGFTRWGWPWHGLCEGGVIGSSGKVVTQPLTCDAWLIDMGLPALDIAPAVVASEAAAGREWRNYALIPGGRVNDTALPDNAFIFVDAAKVRWLVVLSGSFPSTNVVRISASITRFGHFEIGNAAPSSIVKTVDVACENSGLVIERIGEPGSLTYSLRRMVLSDVYTNGSKALMCLELVTGTERVVTSAINVVLTGTGGAAGSGLDLAASEVKGQSQLTAITRYLGASVNIESSVFGFTFTVVDTIVSGCGSGVPGSTIMRTYDYGVTGNVQWRQPGGTGYGGGYPAVTNDLTRSIYCHSCCYDASGAVIANRLKYEVMHDHWITSATATDCGGQNYTTCDGTRVCGAYITGAVCNIAGVYRQGYYLMQNDTVIDYIERGENYAGTQDYPDAAAYFNGFGCAVTMGVVRSVYASTGLYWAGSLVGSLGDPAVIGFDPGQPNLTVAWRDLNYRSEVAVFLSDGVKKIGFNRAGFAAGLFAIPSVGSGRVYGTIMTPIGNKTTSLTGGFYFAWQRKTGVFSFSANPICYV